MRRCAPFPLISISPFCGNLALHSMNVTANPGPVKQSCGNIASNCDSTRMSLPERPGYSRVVSRIRLWFAENFRQTNGVSKKAEGSSEALTRLGEIVEKHRKARGLRQDTMPQGPSSTTMSAIEKGDAVTPQMHRKVELSFRWPIGTIDDILEGAEPPAYKRGGLGRGLASLIPEEEPGFYDEVIGRTESLLHVAHMALRREDLETAYPTLLGAETLLKSLIKDVRTDIREEQEEVAALLAHKAEIAREAEAEGVSESEIIRRRQAESPLPKEIYDGFREMITRVQNDPEKFSLPKAVEHLLPLQDHHSPAKKLETERPDQSSSAGTEVDIHQADGASSEVAELPSAARHPGTPSMGRQIREKHDREAEAVDATDDGAGEENQD